MKQVAKAEREMDMLKAMLQHWEDIGLTITSNNSGMPGKKGAGSRVEAAAIGMVDLECDLRHKIDDFSHLVNEARGFIEKIPQKRYQAILSLKYLSDWSWKSISDYLHYEDRNSVYRAHGWALKELGRVMNDAGKG
jgi:hypothetical protein